MNLHSCELTVCFSNVSGRQATDLCIAKGTRDTSIHFQTPPSNLETPKRSCIQSTEMPRLPDFSDPTIFPSFSSCPLVTSTDSASSDRFLLGTIQQEMTISTSPTFICKDFTGQSFAVTVRLSPDEVKPEIRGGGYDVKGWKKGYSVVLRDAKRSGVSDGKQGFVEVKKEDVNVSQVASTTL